VIRSLSVLLPVHNVQSSLWASVHEILEVLGELTNRFELVIADDGSTDGTWEIARELSQLYPQVRLLREPIRQGLHQTVGRGMRVVQGDVVIAHDGRSPIDAQEIVHLSRSLLTATPAPKFLTGLAQSIRKRSMTERNRNERQCAGFSIVRPRAIDALRREVATSGVR
jgi:glycosyltransferase involved in cell wall biosynthesis